MLQIVPIKHVDANEFVRRIHRHNRPTLGAIFCTAVYALRHTGTEDSGICGVAIVGRPVARRLDDGATVEILRVATDGTRNACSMLYGACRRIARAMGYARIVTYTLPDEGGASLRAAEAIGDDMVGGKWRWVA